MSGTKDIAKAMGIRTEVVAEVFEEILLRVSNGDHVRVKGFGTFKTGVYPGRALSTPKINDGKTFKFEDSVMLKFRQSQIAKQRLNVKGNKKPIEITERSASNGDVARRKPGRPLTKPAKVVAPAPEAAKPAAVAAPVKAAKKTAPKKAAKPTVETTEAAES